MEIGDRPVMARLAIFSEEKYIFVVETFQVVSDHLITCILRFADLFRAVPRPSTVLYPGPRWVPVELRIGRVTAAVSPAAFGVGGLSVVEAD